MPRRTRLALGRRRRRRMQGALAAEKNVAPPFGRQRTPHAEYVADGAALELEGRGDQVLGAVLQVWRKRPAHGGHPLHVADVETQEVEVMHAGDHQHAAATLAVVHPVTFPGATVAASHQVRTNGVNLAQPAVVDSTFRRLGFGRVTQVLGDHQLHPGVVGRGNHVPATL